MSEESLRMESLSQTLRFAENSLAEVRAALASADRKDGERIRREFATLRRAYSSLIDEIDGFPCPSCTARMGEMNSMPSRCPDDVAREEALREQLLMTGRVGGHDYGKRKGTADCRNGCGCWIGPWRSGGPDHLDPWGPCPNQDRAVTTETAEVPTEESV